MPGAVNIYGVPENYVFGAKQRCRYVRVQQGEPSFTDEIAVSE